MNRSDLIWHNAIVIEHDRRQWLEFPAIHACARCRMGKGCGAGVFGLFFAGRKPRLPMPLTEHWQAGDSLRVGVSARQLMQASMALYLFPLLCFMLGIALCAALLSPGQEGWTLLAGIVCAAVGLIVVRSRTLRFQSLHIEPVSDQTQTGNCNSQARA